MKMWDGETINSEQIVKKYGHIIENYLQDICFEKRKNAWDKIQLILDVLSEPFDDFNNSLSEFPKWLDELRYDSFRITESQYNKLNFLWKKYVQADNEWKTFYYSLKGLR